MSSTPPVREINLAAGGLVRALLDLDPRRRLALLDSCGARGDAARFLVAGFDPFKTIEARGTMLRVSRREGASGTRLGESSVARGELLRALDEHLSEHAVAAARLAADVPLVGGACIATFSYDLVRTLERVRGGWRGEHSDEPDAVLAFYDTLVVHDYSLGRTWIVGGVPERLDEAEAAILTAAEARSTPAAEARPATSAAACASGRAASNFTPREYVEAVLRIKEHIYAGDIYQANLTQRFTCALGEGCGPEDVFLRLRRDHPAPFAAFIRRGEDTVVSASPERFLRVAAGGGGARVVEAWPIKGTRPRGADAREDARLRAELLASEKDRAENVMIVDLLRNDLGRVCRFGSVEVAALCAVEEHPTLFHLVSKVRGELRADCTAGGLLRAAFPCGSVTGAPKIRAMEILDRAEPAPRGLSMGAVGYFGFDGSLDLSVAIRTMVVRGRTARFNVGGGIVADSQPELEYEESLLKARALLRALGVEAGQFEMK